MSDDPACNTWTATSAIAPRSVYVTDPLRTGLSWATAFPEPSPSASIRHTTALTNLVMSRPTFAEYHNYDVCIGDVCIGIEVVNAATR